MLSRFAFRSFVFAICLLTALPLAAQQYMLREGASPYMIVLPQSANAEELSAASMFQHYFARCTGVMLPIVTDAVCTPSHSAILIGKTRFTDLARLRDEELRNDGFLICRRGDNLQFYSLEARGLTYGVAYFMEHFMGVRVYAPSAIVTPRCTSMELPEVDVLSNPSFAYREELYYYPNHSQHYADFHALHNRADMRREWGMFVHTFRHLVPVERYFDTHPEWFSQINGKRVRDGQLCLSNPQVLDTLCANLEAMIRANPEATIWSVSNNDNYNVCTCPKCRHLDSLYGGASGTLVHFINKVAERFPDKTISTLGYQFTRQAPTSDIRPRDNVNIMFCSIECGREKPLSDDPSFCRDMEAWAAKTDNIFMWDYVVQFRSMLNPFPNLQVLQPNLQFFHRNGVRMMFEQGTGADNKTSWMELRSYLLAKLMWNVDADVDSLTDDFCRGYYGPAAKPIKDFYAEMHRALNASAQRLDIYGFPINGVKGYLSPDQMKRYQSLIAEAYRLTAKDSAYTTRVRYLELSLDYAVLELAMSDVSPELSFFQGHNRTLNQEMVDRADRFVRDCDRFGVESLVEMGRSPEQFRADIDNFINKSSLTNLAHHAPIALRYSPDDRYPAGGADGLVNGLCGLLNYNYNWVGFYGNELDATIDLGDVKPVSEVSLDFFFFPLSWIFVPERVELFLSDDAEHWNRVGEIAGHNPEELARPDIHPFRFAQLDGHARYVRVVAHPLPSIPSWHRAVGNPVWMFCDEILVR